MMNDMTDFGSPEGHTAVAPDAPPTALCHLQWLHLEISHRLQDALALEAPYTLGALIRSVLGLALNRRSPAAFALFVGDQDDMLRPWWLCPPEVGDATWLPAGALLKSRLTLMPDALPHLSACLEALADFGTLGLGSRRAPAVLIDVRVIGPAGPQPLTATVPALWSGDAVWQAAQAETPAGADAGPLQIQAHTPLRLKERGQVLRRAPTLEALVHTCFSRAQRLLPPGSGVLLHGPAKAVWLRGDQGQWPRQVELGGIRVPRYSARQGRAIEIDGLIGHWRYDHAGAALPWLRLAEHLQLGGKTTLGFGALQVQRLASTPIA